MGFTSTTSQTDVNGEQVAQLFIEATESELLEKRVDTLEDVYEMYNDYSFINGFAIKKNSSHKSSKDGHITSKIYSCYAEGKKLPNKDVVGKKSQRHKKNETRLQCKAHIVVKPYLYEQGWVVTRHVMEHTHPFLNPRETHMLPSHRHISKQDIDVLEDMVRSGIKKIDAYIYIKNQMGGSPELGFTARDAYNVLAKRKREKFTDGDAQELISMFEWIKKRDPDFFYDYKVDDENHLESVFWRDKTMKDDYLLFRDLLVFDTTFKTDKYGLSCGPFVSMNHHRRNIIVGCGFVRRETISSFEWLFNTFKSSMDDVQPITLITDQDTAMDHAIRLCFPQSLHKLCTWHLGQNAQKHLAHYYLKAGFGDLFRFFLNKCETEEEFYATQGSLEDRYGVGVSKWFKNLLQIKSKWCNAFNKDRFTGGAMSSQRSESLNSSLAKNRRATMELMDCYHMFCEVIKHWRGKESKDNTTNKIGLSSFANRYSSILLNARKIYTIRAFKVFEEEYKRVDGCRQVFQGIMDEPNDSKVQTYHVFQKRHEQLPETRFIVQYREVDNGITCECGKMVSCGILCCHALTILNINTVTSIPQEHYFKRWTRQVRPEPDANQEVDINGENVRVPLNWQVELVRKFNRIARESVNNARARKICEEGLKNIIHEVELECGNVDMEEEEGSENSISNISNLVTNRKKGESTERFKSAVEKNSNQKKKARKNDEIQPQPETNEGRSAEFQQQTDQIHQSQDKGQPSNFQDGSMDIT